VGAFSVRHLTVISFVGAAAVVVAAAVAVPPSFQAHVWWISLDFTFPTRKYSHFNTEKK